MRKDMKHVVINTSRSGGGYTKGNTRQLKEKDLDNLPERQGMRVPHIKGWGGKEQRYRTAPLRSYLISQVGRHWDDIWKDICQHTDYRNIRGAELRQHVKWQVVFYEDTAKYRRRRLYSYYIKQLYTDKNNILRYSELSPLRSKPKPKETTDIFLKDGTHFQKIKGCWFRVTSERVMRNIQRVKLRYSPESDMGKWYLKRNKKIPIVKYTEAVEVSPQKQIQLGRKDLKYYGLKNDNQ
jgi:hypothetical protein